MYLGDADIPAPGGALCLYDDCDVTSGREFYNSRLQDIV